MNAPDPKCPRCKGTGRWVMFQLPEPCECTEPEPTPTRRGALTPDWPKLSREEWQAALFPPDEPRF